MVRDAEGWNLELMCKIVWTQKILLDPKDFFGPKKYFWAQKKIFELGCNKQV